MAQIIKKKKSPNRMEKVHFANAKLTSMYIKNIINLEKQMKIKMSILYREKQEVEVEFKAQKKEKNRIRSQPKIECIDSKAKSRPKSAKTLTNGRPSKSALRSAATAQPSRTGRRVAFAGANESDSDDITDTDEDQTQDETKPNLIFSGLTPSRRTQMSIAKVDESSGDDDDEFPAERPPPPVMSTFRNAFSGRRRSSCKDDAVKPPVSANTSKLLEPQNQIKLNTSIPPTNTPLMMPMHDTRSGPSTMSLKAQAFQTEMRMFSAADLTGPNGEFSGRFRRRRSRSAIMSDVLRMRRQSAMAYRPPSAPSMTGNMRGRSQSFAGASQSQTGRQQSTVAATGAVSSDWNKQAREKLNDPKIAYRLPSLVVDESESKAFFVQLNHMGQEKKKVKETDTLLFLRKVDQTRENEELNVKLHQYLRKAKASGSVYNEI